MRLNQKPLTLAFILLGLLVFGFAKLPRTAPQDYAGRHARLLRAFSRYEHAVWHVVSQPWIFQSGDIDSAYYELQAAKQAAGWGQ